MLLSVSHLSCHIFLIISSVPHSRLPPTFPPFSPISVAVCSCVQRCSDRNCCKRCVEAFGHLVMTTLCGLSVILVGMSLYTAVEQVALPAVLWSFLQARVLSWFLLLPTGFISFAVGFYQERQEFEEAERERERRGEEEREGGSCYSGCRACTEYITTTCKL